MPASEMFNHLMSVTIDGESYSLRDFHQRMTSPPTPFTMGLEVTPVEIGRCINEISLSLYGGIPKHLLGGVVMVELDGEEPFEMMISEMHSSIMSDSLVTTVEGVSHQELPSTTTCSRSTNPRNALTMDGPPPPPPLTEEEIRDNFQW